jgi:hypothetical protein
MAFRYEAWTGTFSYWAPVYTIRETQFGYDKKRVYYPDVNSCTTLTLLLSDQSLLGAHLFKADSANVIRAIFSGMNMIRAGRPVLQLCVLGMLDFQAEEGWINDPRYKWPRQLKTFNKTFGRPSGAPVKGYMQTEPNVFH